MSKDHIIQYIKNRMSPTDLIEKIEPYITTEDLLDYLDDFITDNFHDIFSEELEEYYGEE